MIPFAPASGSVLGIDHQRIGVRPVGDPVLGAVQHVAVVLLLRPEPHRHHVRAGARLRHRQRPHMLPRHQSRQVLLLLRVGPVQPDLVHAEVRMRAVAQRHARACPRDLLHRHHVRKVAEPRAAELLRHGDPEQPQRPHLPPQLRRKPVLPVDLRRPRRHPVLGPSTHQVPQRIDVLPEREIQRSHEHRRLPQARFSLAEARAVANARPRGHAKTTRSTCCRTGRGLGVPAKPAKLTKMNPF